MAKTCRPTKYKEEYNQIAYESAKLGLIDTQIAKILNINVSNYNEWKKQYPYFRESIKRGKSEFDTEVVEKSILKRALGYETEEITTETSKLGITTTKTVKKRVPADVTAMIFWLKNRNNQRWKDLKRQEIISEDKNPLLIEITNQGSSDKN